MSSPTSCRLSARATTCFGPRGRRPQRPMCLAHAPPPTPCLLRGTTRARTHTQTRTHTHTNTHTRTHTRTRTHTHTHTHAHTLPIDSLCTRHQCPSRAPARAPALRSMRTGPACADVTQTGCSVVDGCARSKGAFDVYIQPAEGVPASGHMHTLPHPRTCTSAHTHAHAQAPHPLRRSSHASSSSVAPPPYSH
jgi:hypothetical protein